ncbi:Fic family protein [Lunatibacter salilacus]|uniref:Fic family protein n=1 Tax=Lunatibacter salilacus TaxID=2483804 RepID=UPI00131EC9AD|nr:Fic family protein [Lunatibacter salilacus]
MDISKKMDQKLDFESPVHRKINRLLGVIDTFKGSWKVLEQTKSGYLKELRKIATIESTGSSTRIEGATLTDEEVEKLLRSVKISKLEKREEQEVVGYYEALEIILENHGEIPLTQNYIHQLHGILLKHSGKDQTHKGRFKNLSNQVVANYPDGTQRTIFRTTEPHLTASEMEALLFWTDGRLREQDLHPLLTVSAFVYEFLSIHPYQDGNGRLSRLVTTLLLLKLGYGFVQYVSFEHVVESKKEAYYRALMDGQKNRYSEEERIGGWVLFFLESLVELTKRLETKYDTYSRLKIVLNERQRRIVAYVKAEETAQISGIENSMENYSRNTIKKDLAYLVNEGILLKTGAGRGVRYHIKK